MTKHAVIITFEEKEYSELADKLSWTPQDQIVGVIVEPYYDFVRDQQCVKFKSYDGPFTVTLEDKEIINSYEVFEGEAIPQVRYNWGIDMMVKRAAGIESMKKDIAQCLTEYLPKLAAMKQHPLYLSEYRVEKPWGYEIWLDLNEHYAFKLIHMKQGFSSSYQSHNFKVEANYVIAGKAEVLLEDDDGEVASYTFETGMGWTVPVGRKHKVIAKTDYTALEVSSPNLNDVIRYDDIYGRGDGKIESEHKS